jgi:hypothetical protein
MAVVEAGGRVDSVNSVALLKKARTGSGSVLAWEVVSCLEEVVGEVIVVLFASVVGVAGKHPYSCHEVENGAEKCSCSCSYRGDEQGGAVGLWVVTRWCWEGVLVRIVVVTLASGHNMIVGDNELGYMGQSFLWMEGLVGLEFSMVSVWVLAFAPWDPSTVVSVAKQVQTDENLRRIYSDADLRTLVVVWQ